MAKLSQTVNPKIESSYYIFKSLFLIRTTREAVLDLDHIERFGIRSTGDKKMDAQLAGSPVDTYVNIAKMAEMVDQGFRVGLLKPEDDAVRLYNYIQYHLDCWMNVIGTSLNKNDAPIDDLLKLDNLANAIYSLSSKYFDTAPKEGFSTFLSGLDRSVSFDIDDLLNASDTVKQATEEPQRYSYHEALLEAQAKLLK